MNYMLKMKDMPKEQRPRERLMREGPGVLSDVELLAIILRTGSSDKSAMVLSTEVISHFSGLKNLVQAEVEELSMIKGMGPAKSSQLKAALEIGIRLAGKSEDPQPAINRPQDAAAMVMEEMRHLDREHFCALLLNTKNKVLAKKTISIGTLNASVVHPRELFKTAIKKSASSIILIHNHPSGDPTPSREDIEVTQRLKNAGAIVGIEVLDHIIIGDNNFVSFKDKGML
ncbi:MAG: DNA repair protein RadC [Peptococcaceae bacterium]|nr:DNA repair protein RadC [Peptococcaceae bacterium]